MKPPNEARTLSLAEVDRGWVELNCECHAYVFRTDLVCGLPAEVIEQCPKTGLLGVRIEAMREREAAV